MAKMKALVKEEDTVAIREDRRPQLQAPDEVIIQVKIAGLCRRDVYAEGRIATAGPLILGHEFSGVISERATQVKAHKEGDRVMVNPQLACGQCPSCWAGESLSCPHGGFLGVHRNGAFAEYIGVPAAAVHQLPESVSFKQGAYTEPVAASLAVLKAGITVQERGLIYGDNRISRLTHAILETYGLTDVAIFDASQGMLPADTYETSSSKH